MRKNTLEDLGRLAIAVSELVSRRRGKRGEERALLNREVIRARNTLLVAIRSFKRRTG